jgi:2,4-diketo-3-deoxy-L-fuconate hydrolase
MKLVRIGSPGKERPALLDSVGQLRDISKVIADIGGQALLPETLSTPTSAFVMVAKVRLAGHRARSPCAASLVANVLPARPHTDRAERA